MSLFSIGQVIFDKKRIYQRLMSFFLPIILILGLGTLGLSATPSNYEVSFQAEFNQPSFYPIKQNINPNLYQPIAPWIGRLILPSNEDIEKTSREGQFSDWVWIEILHTPPEAKSLVGQTLRLTWNQNPLPQAYRKLVTTDIKFSQAAIAEKEKGNVLPTRLDGLQQVGPLQTLAGTRPNDDVLIGLQGAKIIPSPLNKENVLEIGALPLQITGHHYGLVKIEQPAPNPQNIPSDCPGAKPCPNEFFQVRHYNPISKEFDGESEIVRIPQQPRLRQGRFASTPRDIEKSPAGQAGWYIYGAQDQQGTFVVQALKPRLLFELKPDKIILGEKAGLDYLRNQKWKNTPQLKGTIQTVLIDPKATEDQSALQVWKKGDYGLVIHSFGGIGGKNGEGTLAGTVTGHFSYGISQIIEDPFTKELQFQIDYQQTYAHNTEGIIAGWQSWENYMGNLQRGWLGTRPVSDIIVKMEGLTTTYKVNGVEINPLGELFRQLAVINARYRSGDGTGVSQVTPATSCVQDSNQALYIAIEQIRRKIGNPSERESLSPQLFNLGQDLMAKLVPEGVVRPDWRENAAVLAGAGENKGFMRDKSWSSAILSWRSMFPRGAHDQISEIFLRNNAYLWVMRTNQVGGWDEDILPLAPTVLFGDTPVISVVLRRMLIAAITFPSLQTGLMGLGILAIYAAIAIPLGLKTGFLKWGFYGGSLPHFIGCLALTFISPSLIEELLMRVAWLPQPTEGVSGIQWLFWALLSLGIFVIYHPLNAKFFYKKGNPTFFNPVFLLLTTLLGVVCIVAYGLSRSLWIIVLIHWVVVVTWLFFLGGEKRLGNNSEILEKE